MIITRLYLLLSMLIPLAALAGVVPYTWGDLSRFDRLPEVGGVAVRQSSGWDRVDATGHGVPAARTPEGAYILLQADGPGCLTWLYAQAPDKGRLRCYFDGEAAPRIEIEWPVLAAQLRGKTPIPANSPFQPPFMAIGYYHIAGALCVPYAKSLLITSETPIYQQRYQFTYCRYPDGTPLASYTPGTAPSESAGALRALHAAGPEMPPPLPGCRRVESQVDFAGHGAATIARLPGAGVVRRLWIGLTPAELSLMRRLLLRAAWDGEAEPSVFIPLADLCGAPWPGAAPQALSRVQLQGNSDLVRQESCRVLYPMPFAAGAELSLVHAGSGHAGPLPCVVDYQPLETLPADWGRLRAGYYQGNWPGDTAANLLALPGPGRLVGLSMTAWPWRTGKWDNDVEAHWQLIVDEAQTLAGDGWLIGWEAAQGAFSGQSDLPTNKASFSRQYPLDGPRFTRSLFLRLLPRPARTHFTQYTLGWVWYGDAASAVPAPAIAPEALAWPLVDFGFIEGEDLLETARVEHGRARVVEDPDNRFMLSKGKMLLFTPRHGQGALDLWVPVEKSGRYKLEIRHFQGIRFDGIWHVAVNGVRGPSGIRNLSTFPGVRGFSHYTLSERLSYMQNWGTFDFTAPSTRLTFTFDPIVGPPTAEEALAIDGIRLTPVEKQ
ncbi:MAG: DUF2961 domain-containing protein [Armatimonadota bacterium]